MCKDHSIKTVQIKYDNYKGTIILETNFIRICVLNFIFLSSNILSVSLNIIALKMTKPNKSNILTTIDRINQNLKKVEKIIYMFLKSRKLFLPCNPRVKDLVLFDGDIYIYIYAPICQAQRDELH